MAKAGNRSKYESHVKPKLATITAWARKGLTKTEIAENLHVALSSFMEYQNKYPELSEALKDGIDDAISHVENAMFKAALGHEYEETKIVYDVDENGRPAKISKIEKTKKVVQPNITAGIFILKNRASKDWRDVRQMDVRNQDGLDNYTKDELVAALKELD